MQHRMQITVGTSQGDRVRPGGCVTKVAGSTVVVSDWKVQTFSWPKGTSRESVESKFMGTTCLSEELGRLKTNKRLQ